MNRQISLNHHLFATKDSRNIEHIDCFELYGFCGEKTHKKVPKIQHIDKKKLQKWFYGDCSNANKDTCFKCVVPFAPKHLFTNLLKEFANHCC